MFVVSLKIFTNLKSVESNRANDPPVLVCVDNSWFFENDIFFEYFESGGREDLTAASYSKDT